MKKVIVFILSFLWVSADMSGQDSDIIRRYFEITHEATKAVVMNDHPKAINLYRQAFELRASPFSIDVQNMIYTLSESAEVDSAEMFGYLKMMQNKGRCIHEFYVRYPKIAPYCALMDHNDCSKTNNKEMTDWIQQLMKNDQAARSLHPKDPYHASVIDQVRATDSTNYQSLIKVLRYLLENKLQAEDELGITGIGSINVLLQHNAGWGFYNKSLTDSLILMGCLDSRYLAEIYDHNCRVNHYRNAPQLSNWSEEMGCVNNTIYGSIVTEFTEFTGEHKEIVLFIPSAARREQLNKRRREIYLQDIVDCRKFSVFALLNKSAFSFPPQSTMMLGDEHEIEQVIHTLSDLENGTFIKYAKKEDFNFE